MESFDNSPGKYIPHFLQLPYLLSKKNQAEKIRRQKHNLIQCFLFIFADHSSCLSSETEEEVILSESSDEHSVCLSPVCSFSELQFFAFFL